MYNDYYSNEMDMLAGPMFIAAVIVALIIGLISYVIYGLIFFKTAKTNGFDDAAYISWIPIANFYMLFLLTGDTVDRSVAKKWFWIYVALIALSWIPVLGWILSIASVVISIYFYYRLLYRWTAEQNKAILYDVLTMISGGLFFMIYGLMRMNRPFKV